MPTSYGPYTPVRKSGNLLFISGQIGINQTTKTTEPDIASQTIQAINNLEALLREEKLDLSHVVKTTVFIVDMGMYAAMNTAYESKFPTPRPARSAVGVKELPRVGGNIPILVEIEAIVSKGVE